MSYRLINPGFAAMLNSYAEGTQYTDSIYSRTGYSFTQTGQSNTPGIESPGYSVNDAEFWMKLDVYIGYKNSSYTFYCGAPDSIGATSAMNGFSVSVYSSYVQLALDYKKSGSNYSSSVRQSNDYWEIFKKNAINTFLLRVKYGAAGTGIISLNVNRKATYTIDTYEVSRCSNTKNSVILQDYSGNVKFSNIICSDEEISLKETIAALPVSTVTTTMTDNNDGTYTANEANQQVLQTVDTAQLIADYGGDSQITGIAITANPAYRTGEGLASLAAISDTETFGTKTVSEETTSMVMEYHSLSNTTLADLTGKKFGWKSGV